MSTRPCYAWGVLHYELALVRLKGGLTPCSWGSRPGTVHCSIAQIAGWEVVGGKRTNPGDDQDIYCSWGLSSEITSSGAVRAAELMQACMHIKIPLAYAVRYSHTSCPPAFGIPVSIDGSFQID